MANSTNLFSEITIDCFHEYWGGEYYDLYACFIEYFFFNRIVQDSRKKNLERSLRDAAKQITLEFLSDPSPIIGSACQ